MLLPIILVVRLLLFPTYPAVQVERFATEADCVAASAKLDASTPLQLVLTCEVET